MPADKAQGRDSQTGGTPKVMGSRIYTSRPLTSRASAGGAMGQRSRPSRARTGSPNRTRGSPPRTAASANR